LAEADGIVAAARAEAERMGWPMVIAVVDAAGMLVALARMDQAQLGSIEVARHKAETAARFRRPTRAFEAGIAAGGIGLRALSMDVSAVDGGLPLVRDDKVIGAIGVSGMLPTEDAQVALAGAAALG
jgi:uncharacterized protein GlcG (DUF336 family)